MDNREILVSINCLAYNHVNFIRRALDSFLMQKVNFKYEVVIHDDASTDGTTAIIKEYERKYPDIIKPIYETENQYRMGNISERCVYPHLKGKYVAYCEGDDYWVNPNKLQKQVDYLEAHPECSFTFHNAEMVWPNEKRYRIFFPGERFKSLIWKNQDLKLNAGQLIQLGFIPTASIVARTQYVVTTPRFCENSICGDLPLRLYLSLNGDAYYFNEIMSAYRIGNQASASGQAHSSNEKLLKTLNGHIDILEGFNKYSNFKWDKEVKYDILRRKLNYCIESCNVDMLKEPEIKRLMKKEVTFIGKIKFYAHCYFEGAYALLKQIRNKKKNI